LKKNIFLIGHKSFIGESFKKNIFKNKKNFNLYYLNSYFFEKDIYLLKKEDFFKKYFSQYKNIDIIISCLHIHKNNFEEELNLNTKIYQNILYYAKFRRVKKIIYISSVNVSNRKISHYAYVKFKIENLIKKFNYFTIIRPSTVIKIDRNKKLLGGRDGSSFDLIEKFIKFNIPFPIIGNGKYLFTFCFLDNLSNFILLLLKDNTLINKTINFFSDENLTFNTFIDNISRIKKKKIIKIYIPIFIIKYFSNIKFFKLFSKKNLYNILNQKITYNYNNVIKKKISLDRIEDLK
jgi:nucleoside-diphosphate-sugar epimerase